MKEKQKKRGKVFHAPWEKAFDRILEPFEEFIHRQTTSSLLLMASALLALVWANSSYSESYQHLIHTPMGVTIGTWGLEKSLQHWVNDALMTLFFFLVGLELKREVLVGELSDFRQALLPVVAAVGGMVFPALFYAMVVPDGDMARGWGIPMATDIAFAIGALALLGSRVPKALITFLVALAIIDDLGAVIVIAVAYTEEIVLQALLASAVVLSLLIAMNRAGVRHPLPYFLLGTVLWFALLKSGVHATLAGVLTAFTIPAGSKYDPVLFRKRLKELLNRFDASYQPGDNILVNERLQRVVQNLETGIYRVEPPLQRLEHALHMPVAFVVIPIFALINAGVPMDFSSLGKMVEHPVTLAVIVGLVGGKFLGIAGSCWLALKLGIGQLPHQTRFTHIAGLGLLSGIGFTMSIFIAELAFLHQPNLLLSAKSGILIASLIAGLGGYLWLYLAGNTPHLPEDTPSEGSD
ncbi:MAG: Na+/H+ antiporter NhaA [Magnetococcales bacterium]|nr:Na+/H+ antiporter NhaA [Magnetococcales bacterium]